MSLQDSVANKTPEQPRHLYTDMRLLELWIQFQGTLKRFIQAKQAQDLPRSLFAKALAARPLS